MDLDRSLFDAVKKPCGRFTVGDSTEPKPNASYVGGTPFAPAGTEWPQSPSGPLTFLGQFGLASDAWIPGDTRWLSVFLNEAEGYVEPGDEQHCTIWLHEGEAREPVAAPEGARVDEARSIVITEKVSMPISHHPGLGDWRNDGAAYEEAVKELYGENLGECQIGGYPLIYGGGDLDISGPSGQHYELIVVLTRYPLKNGGFDVNIADVLNIYFDTEGNRLVADMDR